MIEYVHRVIVCDSYCSTQPEKYTIQYGRNSVFWIKQNAENDIAKQVHEDAN